jgi:PhzF family phenazine biosynthesis protein
MTAEVLRYAAFTEDGRGGNPAGVVLGAGGLSDPQMLAVAQAIGYSETAFVLPADGTGRIGIRYFSPRAEGSFCGHATIATAVALAERGRVGEMVFSTPAGPVPVTTTEEGGVRSATLTSRPTTTRPVDPDVLRRALETLGWSASDLDPAYPAHVAHAGNDHLLLAARTDRRLADLDYDFDGLGALMAEQGWTTVCLFRVTGAGEVEVRNAFPPGGVVEDPATGAAAAALGGYLRDLALIDAPARLVLHQGRHVGAPSRLLVDVTDAGRQVSVTGTATRLAMSPYDDLDLP